MLRGSAARSLARLATTQSSASAAVSRSAVATMLSQRSSAVMSFQQHRMMGGHGPAMTSSFKDPREVEERVIDVLSDFPGIDKTKLVATSHFEKDLGMDSLDQVEVVLAIEDEFRIRLTDQEAETMHTVGDIIKYVCESPHST
jgi:NADH dehydrogenase (ubiquinone) 1 alpha/beta subcomplex 1